MNPEVLSAKRWYIWLWLSPFLTIPTAIFLGLALMVGSWYRTNCVGDNCDYLPFLIAFLGSALWHLVLLIPALTSRSEFVRWHGWQALLLAGIRTAIPVALLTYDYFTSNYFSRVFWSIPILLAVWLFGTLWGQGQAGRGDCSLMRWAGQGAGLPLSIRINARPPKVDALIDRASEPDDVFRKLPVAADSAPEFIYLSRQKETKSESPAIEQLVDIFRFSQAPDMRRKALAELQRLGFVEPL